MSSWWKCHVARTGAEIRPEISVPGDHLPGSQAAAGTRFTQPLARDPQRYSRQSLAATSPGARQPEPRKDTGLEEVEWDWW